MIAPLLIWLGLLLQAGPATGPAVAWSDVDGQRWQSVAGYEDVRRSPRWSGTGAPPLSAGDAATAARLVLARSSRPWSDGVSSPSP